MAILPFVRSGGHLRFNPNDSISNSPSNGAVLGLLLNLMPQKYLQTRDSFLFKALSLREYSLTNFAHYSVSTIRAENSKRKKMSPRLKVTIRHCSDHDSQQLTTSADDSLESPSENPDKEDSELEYTLVASMQTQYSLINVVDIPSTAGNNLAGARLLLLDSSGGYFVHL